MVRAEGSVVTPDKHVTNTTQAEPFCKQLQTGDHVHQSVLGCMHNSMDSIGNELHQFLGSQTWYASAAGQDNCIDFLIAILVTLIELHDLI